MNNSRLAINGGSPTRSQPWPTYDQGHVVLDQEDEAELVKAFRSNMLFRYDIRPLEETPVGKFEQIAKEFFGVEYALATTSGTAALMLSLLASGVGPGDEVAMSAFTFVATPSAITQIGARPILIEVDKNLNLDLTDLKKKKNANMKALVVIHMKGAANDMEAIMNYANSVNLVVIEDSVPAMGGSLGKKRLGTYGHAGAFSTQSDKSCNTGEGGLLVTNDSLLFAKAIVLSGAYEGRWKKHFAGRHPDMCDLDYPVFSVRMDNLRGALAYSQMVKLPARLEKLAKNYLYVTSRLQSLSLLRLREPAVRGGILGDTLLFRLPGLTSEQVRWFTNALWAEGIIARPFGADQNPNVRCYWNWSFLFPALDIESRKRLLPNTTRYLEELIEVPLSPVLEQQDLDDLVTSIYKVAEEMVR